MFKFIKNYKNLFFSIIRSNLENTPTLSSETEKKENIGEDTKRIIESSKNNLTSLKTEIDEYGTISQGDFLDNAGNGKGKKIYKNGDVYEGEFKNYKRHGIGIYIYNVGEIYDGEYQNNKMHGQGKYTFKDGSFCEGQFENDVLVFGIYKDKYGNKIKNVVDWFRGEDKLNTVYKKWLRTEKVKKRKKSKKIEEKTTSLGVIDSINIEKTKRGLDINLNGNKSFDAYVNTKKPNPLRIVVYMFDQKISKKIKIPKIFDENISEITLKYANEDETLTQIELILKNDVKYEIGDNGTKLKITILKKGEKKYRTIFKPVEKTIKKGVKKSKKIEGKIVREKSKNSGLNETIGMPTWKNLPKDIPYFSISRRKIILKNEVAKNIVEKMQNKLKENGYYDFLKELKKPESSFLKALKNSDKKHSNEFKTSLNWLKGKTSIKPSNPGNYSHTERIAVAYFQFKNNLKVDGAYGIITDNRNNEVFAS